jgi:hypothetical protein
VGCHTASGIWQQVVNQSPIFGGTAANDINGWRSNRAKAAGAQNQLVSEFCASRPQKPTLANQCQPHRSKGVRDCAVIGAALFPCEHLETGRGPIANRTSRITGTRQQPDG